MSHSQRRAAWREGLPAAGRRAARRVAAAWWPIAQGTAAAAVAWVIARYVLDHPEPFFAPVAAVIGLNTTVGERGLNAVKLLQGVIVGILTGELVLLAFGSGWAGLALAAFVAMIIALALGGTRIVIAQAAVGAILTIAVGTAEAGGERLIDALVGVGVAIVFSNLLFSPEPVRLIRRAEEAALSDMAEGLTLTAEALENDDDELGERSVTSLRELRDRLAELSRMRVASERVARRSLAWRGRKAPVVRESENAGYLDLLGVSCLMLARTALRTNRAEHRQLAPLVRTLAAAIAEVAEDPGDRDRRQRAADRALEVARLLASVRAPAGSPLTASVSVARTVASDLMSFAGVEPDQAAQAVREGTGRFDIPTPPPTPRTPFRSDG